MHLNFSFVAAAALAFAGGAANASLTLSGPENFQGTGLGNVNTILTIQSPGSTTSETGQVAFSNGSDVITGNAMTGGSQTQTSTSSVWRVARF